MITFFLFFVMVEDGEGAYEDERTPSSVDSPCFRPFLHVAALSLSADVYI